MDNTDVKFDREKFEAVWRRVMPETADGTRDDNAVKQLKTDDARRLRGFMDNEAQDARTYRTAAAMCSGAIRQRLLQISWDEQRHFKKLKANYFILTGEMYKPPEACPLICDLPETLRRKYRDEKEGSAAYRAAAGNTPVNELGDTYQALAEDEARHSEMIGCIIENIM